MSFKLNGTPYNKDNMNIGVYRRDLKDGSAGKSNHTGIIIDKDVSKEMEDAVIAHEKVHQHQQRNGELDYDDNNFYWKGKTYPRKNLNEHNENLPWEKEAYAVSNKMLNGKDKNMKERFQLKGYRGNNKPFKTLSDRGLIGPSMEGGPGGPGDDKKIKKEAQSKADANLKKTEFKTEKLDDGRTRHYRSAEGTADKPGSTVVKAKTTGKKATDTDDYISRLKTRFPDATGEELVKKKYISSSYADQFPAKKETAKASEEYFTKKPDTPKTPPTKTPPSETPTYTTSTKTKNKRPKVKSTKTKQKLYSCKPGTDCGVNANKKAKKGDVISNMFKGNKRPKSKKGFSKKTGLVKK